MNISKAAVVLARCSPRDIVGVRTRLCFDLDGSAKKPNSPAPSPFRSWSGVFTNKLNQLLAHQAWSTGQPGGRVSSLAAALQYTVILRTEDKREWDMEFTDPILVQMQDHIKSKVSAREAHTKARDVILQSGIPINMYHISNVFKALEEYVVVVPERIDEYSLYHVTSDDLRTIIQALDNMADPDTGCLNPSTEMFYKMSVTIRPSHGISPDGKDLDRVHEEVMLEESRRMLYYERLCADRNRRGGAATKQKASTSLATSTHLGISAKMVLLPPRQCRQGATLSLLLLLSIYLKVRLRLVSRLNLIQLPLTTWTWFRQGHAEVKHH